MPIEIRELTIKVSVNQPSQSGGEGSSQPPITAVTDKIVADAVQQVLDIINHKQER